MLLSSARRLKWESFVFSKLNQPIISSSISAIVLWLSSTTISILAAEIPQNLKVVLDNTLPLAEARQERLPLFVLPISDCLKSQSDTSAEKHLRSLDERGIGYSVDWHPAQREVSLAEGLRIARIQKKIGQPVAINATACLNVFCDGSPETLHVDRDGNRFSDNSCGAELGCPFALEHRIPVIRRQVEFFVDGYRDAGVSIDFIFADWEIDGPIEWNESWSASKRCQRCRQNSPGIEDFHHFQSTLRKVRSRLQRDAFASVITQSFPQALVGNYGVYPNDGYRYWYDYFERPANDGMPFRKDQGARYREWYPEFPETGYTFAMPVIYTWYPTFGWYDFKSTDYRWFYNMLLNGTNAGRHSPSTTPVIPFVHWHTTAPPPNADPGVVPMSESAYQELLWHLLLRGHDTFFLWCMSDELAKEIRLVHEVYAASLIYRGFLNRGEPICFDVPAHPATVVSGLRLGEQVLVRRTEFTTDNESSTTKLLQLAGNPVVQIEVPSSVGNQIVKVQPAKTSPTILRRGNESLFPIGWYELPENDADLRELADAGVNLVRCGDRTALDRAKQVGLLGWVPLPIQQGATSELRQQIVSVMDHPALAVWEGPDEIVWTFTAYSTLAKSVGIKKEDWYDQRTNAVTYAESQAAIILPKMRAGIELVRTLDSKRYPFWMNEAADSDLRYVRGYASVVDTIGCDYYPVRSSEYDMRTIGRMVDRWSAVGRGKPVWMVLQAFSWHRLNPERKRRYPNFDESRFMAYNAISHGTQGILYWGSNFIDDPDFRQSLYSLTAELDMLQPFLTEPSLPGIDATVIKDLFEPAGVGIRTVARQSGEDLCIILVNEDEHRHLAVDVRGLSKWNDRKLFELYGTDEVSVDQGNIAVRMKPLDVKIYCTGRRFESLRRTRRDYVSPTNAKQD